MSTILHYERECWLEQPGIYATESVPTSNYGYQTGWCGGLINTRALVHARDAQVRARSLQTIDTLLTVGQSPSGLLWGKYTQARGFSSEYAHEDARPWTQRWTLARLLAWRRFQIPRYCQVAEAAGQAIIGHLDRGMTNGPADAVHAPNSQSVAALVESYAALHAATGDATWRKH